MSIIPSPSSRKMRNNTVSIQHSDEIIIKAYYGCKRENFARELELLVHFQIGLGLSVASLMWVLLVAFF